MPEGRSLSTGFVVAFLVSCGSYLAIGYWIDRSQSAWLIGCYTLLFFCYFYFFKSKESNIIIIVAVIFRLILIVSIPALSTDFYRFLWDGELVASGINPYVYPPDHYFNNDLSAYLTEVYNLLSYTIYHSMYPPFTQLTGFLASLIGNDSIPGGIVVLRIFVIGFDLLNIFIIQRLVKMFGLPGNRVLLYALNPLIILELTGNLHHEVYLITFSLGAIYFLEKKRWISSAISLGFAVLSKLLPLIFLPLLFRKIGFKNSMIYCLVVGVVTLSGFAYFLDESLSGLFSSGALYFQKLEFNASIYFLVREVGFWYKGYNIIQTAGIWLGVITAISIITYAAFYKPKTLFPESFMWVWFIYVMFTTTLHPWYITPIIAFSIFTRFRFAVVWSFLIFLTYAGYTVQGYSETYWIFFIEYLLVYGWLIFEMFSKENQSSFTSKVLS